MADEPNTRMDEMLKAYAGKRRQEAGGPLELHPATRQMLQGEVARTYKQTLRSWWLQRVITFWPRVAFATACVAIMITLLFIALPRQRVMEMAQRKPESELLMRDSRLADREKAETSGLDTFANAPAPAASTAPVTPALKPIDELAKENKTDDLKAKSGLMAETRKDADAVRLLREEDVAAKQLAGRFYRANTEPARARYMQRSPDLGVRLQHAQQNAQTVLNGFELQQTGNEVRVIDGDGSVYVGNVLSSDEAKKLSFTVQNAPAASAGAIAGVSGPAQQSTMMFYAVGTNLTLGQKVSIEANVLQAQTNAAPAFAPAEPTKNQRGAAQNTIWGRARVGTNQEGFSFEAVPAKP